VTMAEHRAGEHRGPLNGLNVLVTRPRHQGAGLAASIEKRGGLSLSLPVIDIALPRDPGAARALLASLDDFALVIFISPNAVAQALALMDKQRARRSRARFMAVGESSAAALEQAGFSPVVRPAGSAGSEALLALPELQPTKVAGSPILIVRGEGGRALLGDTLSERGARVTYAEVYRRILPKVNGTALAERGSNGGIDTIVVTSSQGMDNLFALLGDDSVGWLQETGYVVVSERLATRARELGIQRPPIVAAGADDESLLEALTVWRATYVDSGK